MKDLSTSLAVLSSMITPAVLILASGSLILTTSQRLGRIIERVRKLSDQFEKLAHSESQGEKVDEQRHILFILLSKGASRSKLLQKALTSLYLALGVFVATSITIGLLEILSLDYIWVPIILGMLGDSLLFYGSIVMILESRIALSSVDDEMDFVIRSNRMHAPKELLKEDWKGKLLFWKMK